MSYFSEGLLKRPGNQDTKALSVIFMKRLGVLILCFFVLYAGVAWALERCLHPDDRFDHSASLSSGPHRGDHWSSSDFDSPDRLDAELPCPYLHYQIDPGINAPVNHAGLFAGGIAWNSSVSEESGVSSETKALLLSPVFRSFPSFFFANGPSLHLFFSVLRI